MKADLANASATVIGKDKKELLDQLKAATALVTTEIKNSKGAFRKRAAETLKTMEHYEQLEQLRAADTLTPDQAHQLLAAIDHSVKALDKLETENTTRDANNNVVTKKGADGKTLTERRMEAADQLANQESVIALLKSIIEQRDDDREAAKKENAELKKTFTNGLAGFLGPAGPLVEIFTDIRDQYGDDVKNIAGKVKRFLGIQQTLHEELELEGQHERSRTKKLYDMLTYQFRRMGGMLSSISSGSWLRDMWDATIGKTGGGKGGLFTRAKRFLRKIPGARSVMRGASRLAGRAGAVGRSVLGRGASFLGRGAAMAGRLGGRLLAGAGKFLGPLGAVIGLGDIAMNSVDAGADPTQTKLDKGLDYGVGALSGATLGATIGSIIPGLGTVVGGAIGGVVGLLFTGIVRNWTVMKTGMTKIWNGTMTVLGTAWDSTKEFLNKSVDYMSEVWDKIGAKWKSMTEWLDNNIPGFKAWANDRIDDAKAVIATAGTAVAGKVQEGANAVSGAATSTAAAVQSGAQNVAATATQVAQSTDNAAVKAVASTVASGANTVAEKAPVAGATVAANAQSVAAFTGKLAMPNDDTKKSILDASDKIGVDKGLMLSMASAESGFNAKAGAGNTSAQGLYQFTDSTWGDMVKKYGAQYGIGMGDRKDASKNAIMGALYTRDNGEKLKKQGLESGGAAQYAMHFLGPNGGQKFLNALKSNPDAVAADMFPEAAAKNHNIFFDKNDKPKTVKEVYASFQTKIEAPAQAYNAALDKEKAGGTVDAAKAKVEDTKTAKAPEPDKYAPAKAEAAKLDTAATAKATATPAADKYERAPSTQPGTNVSVKNTGAANNAQQQQQQNAGGGGGGGQRTAVADIPTVLGDNYMVIINSGMMGA